MAKVYVSSTFVDLRECREQVRLTLRRMDHEDVAMEYYTAEDARPPDKCLRDVDACDLYVCLVAWRYGHIPEGYEHSITELEYRRAVQAGKPCLAFLLAEDAPWPFNLVEIGAIGKVKAFRQELQQNLITSDFTSAGDIGARVAEAVYAWGKREGISAKGSRTDWETYRAAVFEKHRWVRLAVIAGAKQDRRFTQIPLTDVFIAQRTTAGRPAYDIPEDSLQADTVPLDEPPEALPTLQDPSLDVLGRESKQVILGGPGSGKSTLFHFAMLTLCDPVPSETAIPPGLRHGPLPFLVELRQYALRKARSFPEYVVDQAREFYGVDLELDDLRAVLQQDRRAVVLFDGLDEILNPAERARVVDQFDAFARQYVGAGTVVSSRIAGYDPERLQLGGFSHYTLLDFGLAEIREFVPRWYRYYTWQGDERDAPGLLQRIAESPRLLDLAGNPLLLTMMAVIYKHQDLPEKRWQLYERCTQVLLEDWDVKRKNIERDELMPLDFRMVGEQKAEILENVSTRMLLQHREGGELNAIRRGPLIDILAAYLEPTYNKAPGDARVIATDILNHLRERTYILAEIGEDIFGFVHRTFMEYFAASQARAEFNRRRADYRWLTHEVFGAHWQRDEWREVLLLLIAMLKDQGSPIREVIDHLLSLRVGEPPENLAFAARCLGEAGATDGPWAQEILERLVASIAHWAGETNREAVAQFVDQGLAAFSMLVTAIQPPAALRNTIVNFASRSRRHHMVSWQMELALRSREDRLEFAMTALADVEEGVRLGAIASLEREWPGREEVGPALVEVLRSDRITRVRQAALQALRHSWPEQPEILEAIAKRVKGETAYTYVVWLAQYVSAEWQPDFNALEVMLRLAGTKRRRHQGYYYPGVTEAVAVGITHGWGDLPGMLAWLQDRFNSESDQNIRDAILLATALGWSDTVPLLDWLQEHMDDTTSTVRRKIVNAVAKGSSGRPERLAWLQQRARRDTNLVRVAALEAIGRRWSKDTDVRAWLEHVAVEASDTELRAFVLRTLADNWKSPEIDDLLLKLAENDTNANVRLQALVVIGGHRDYRTATTQPTRIWDPDYWVAHSAYRRWKWSGASEAVALLESRAVEDPDPSIRRAAISGIFDYRWSSPTALAVLRSQLKQDPDRDVRAAALDYLAQTVSMTLLARALLEGLLRSKWDEPANDVTLGTTHPDYFKHRYERPSGADEELRASLIQAAEYDTEPRIRAAAAMIVGYFWHDDPASVTWLRKLRRREQNPQALSVLEGVMRVLE